MAAWATHVAAELAQLQLSRDTCCPHDESRADSRTLHQPRLQHLC
jgi:hypothetical protein